MIANSFAFQELFSELQHSQAKALPPDSLRKALADSFLDQQRFQIGFMDDAGKICYMFIRSQSDSFPPRKRSTGQKNQLRTKFFTISWPLCF